MATKVSTNPIDQLLAAERANVMEANRQADIALQDKKDWYEHHWNQIDGISDKLTKFVEQQRDMGIAEAVHEGQMAVARGEVPEIDEDARKKHFEKLNAGQNEEINQAEYSAELLKKGVKPKDAHYGPWSSHYQYARQTAQAKKAVSNFESYMSERVSNSDIKHIITDANNNEYTYSLRELQTGNVPDDLKEDAFRQAYQREKELYLEAHGITALSGAEYNTSAAPIINRVDAAAFKRYEVEDTRRQNEKRLNEILTDFSSHKRSDLLFAHLQSSVGIDKNNKYYVKDHNTIYDEMTKALSTLVTTKQITYKEAIDSLDKWAPKHLKGKLFKDGNNIRYENMVSAIRKDYLEHSYSVLRAATVEVKVATQEQHNQYLENPTEDNLAKLQTWYFNNIVGKGYPRNQALETLFENGYPSDESLESHKTTAMRHLKSGTLTQDMVDNVHRLKLTDTATYNKIMKGWNLQQNIPDDLTLLNKDDWTRAFVGSDKWAKQGQKGVGSENDVGAELERFYREVFFKKHAEGNPNAELEARLEVTAYMEAEQGNQNGRYYRDENSQKLANFNRQRLQNEDPTFESTEDFGVKYSKILALPVGEKGQTQAIPILFTPAIVKSWEGIDKDKIPQQVRTWGYKLGIVTVEGLKAWQEQIQNYDFPNDKTGESSTEIKNDKDNPAKTIDQYTNGNASIWFDPALSFDVKATSLAGLNPFQSTIPIDVAIQVCNSTELMNASFAPALVSGSENGVSNGEHLLNAGTKYNFPAAILQGIFYAESSFNTHPSMKNFNPNNGGPQGPFQVKRSTGLDHDLKPEDRHSVEKSAEFAAKYMVYIIDRLKDAGAPEDNLMEIALNAYNGGITEVINNGLNDGNWYRYAPGTKEQHEENAAYAKRVLKQATSNGYPLNHISGCFLRSGISIGN